jgi:hypothetical protein
MGSWYAVTNIFDQEVMMRIPVYDENGEQTRLYVYPTEDKYFVYDASNGVNVTSPMTRNELSDWLRNSGLQLEPRPRG